MKQRIGVVFGGKSVEHEISILSAMQAIKAIDHQKYDVVIIYMDKQNHFYVGPNFDNIETFKKENFKKNEVLFLKYGNNQVRLKARRGFLFRKFTYPIDCILSIVHGLGVEDGNLAGYFHILDVPYTASDVLAASVGQDKVIMKQVFKSSKIPVLPFTYFTDNEWINSRKECLEKIKRLDFPVIVKPSRLGSSIGIKIVNQIEDLKHALGDAFNYDNRVIIEKALINYREFNCSVLGGSEDLVLSGIEEIISSNTILTYEDKYVSKEEPLLPKRIIPAEISENIIYEIKDLSIRINKILQNKGVSRIDFLYCMETEKLYVNEINTIPGSLSYYLFEEVDLDFRDLIDQLIQKAIRAKYLDNLKLSSFQTNVLAMNNLLKGKK